MSTPRSCLSALSRARTSDSFFAGTNTNPSEVIERVPGVDLGWISLFSLVQYAHIGSPSALGARKIFSGSSLRKARRYSAIFFGPIPTLKWLPPDSRTAVFCWCSTVPDEPMQGLVASSCRCSVVAIDVGLSISIDGVPMSHRVPSA